MVVEILSLWLPIILSAVLVFVVSSVIHMALKYHNNDFARLPQEDAVLEALRAAKIPPGDYAFPRPEDMKDMRSPEMVKKLEQGPSGLITVIPGWGMGASLVQWFIYCLVLGVLVAYVTGRTVEAGAEYLQVFRVSGAVAFLGHSGAHATASIWSKRKWSTTTKHIFDGFIYALVTAGAFAGFWPE